ncbi:MAG: Crp/Fnr family transcriptional regulator [Actinomycetota bacterium]|nr:Crp/Fnr family transcriptional regulator [Actinomycetota bacterium]
MTGYRGARLILDVGQAPLAGATHAFTQTPACSTSVAITPMRVCTTPAAVFLAIALESPDLARLVLRDLADQLSQTVSAAVELASLSPGARLARHLLELADDEGRIRLEGSQRDLGDRLAVSRQTVSSLLSTILADGSIIRVPGRRVCPRFG